MLGMRKAALELGLPEDGYFKLGLVASVLQGTSAVALLGVSAWLISRAAEVSSIVYLGLAIVGVRGFAVGRAAFRYAERLLLHESAFRMLAALRPRLFERIAPFVPAGMNGYGRGEVIARIVNDVDELQNLPLRVLAPLVQTISVSLLSLIFVTALLPTAGLAFSVAMVVGLLIAFPLSARSAKLADSLIAPLKAELSNLSLNLLENHDVYLAYGWLPQKLSEIAIVDKRLRKAISKSNVSSGVGLALISLLGTVTMFSGAWFGGFALESHQIPGASLAVFALLPLAIFELLQNSQPAISGFRKFKASANRVADLMERQLPHALDIKSGNQDLLQIDSLELKAAGICYPDSVTETIGDLNLKIERGTTTLLSGASGSGKTSIALALARLINLSSGEYLVNGKAIETFTLESIRKQIGLVEQSPTVFLGDVKANLLLAKPSASDDELQNILERVGLWQLFADREGLETNLGDRGILISGGESQRLALARALLADFQVLVLDEPTANVDADQADTLIDDMIRAVHQSPSKSLVLISHEEKYRDLVDFELRLGN